MKVCTDCGGTKPISDFGKAVTCKDGHRSYCKACHKTRKDRWRAANKEHHNEKCRAWVAANTEKRRLICKLDRIKHLSKRSETAKRWKDRNKTRTNICTAMRRRRLRTATPAWADKEDLKSMFIEASYFQLQVDHIIPLKGKTVCGLHVPSNIQLLSRADNASKGNTFDGSDLCK